MAEALLIYLIMINAVTFTAFARDKRAAELGRRRTPERRLLTLDLIGGTPAAMAAQQVLRHKTRKAPFRRVLWILAALHLALTTAALYRLM